MSDRIPGIYSTAELAQLRRERIATAVLTGLAARNPDPGSKDMPRIAGLAVAYADALIRKLDEPETTPR